jgi:hypothetical protein
MSILLKSKLIRSELKHWALIVILFLWALVATVFASVNRDKVLLVGIDDSGTRLITNQSDRLLKSELKSFLMNFFDLYYSYDEKTFLTQVGKATDLFSQDLWNQEKSKLYELNTKLQKVPLTQSFKVESIDRLEDGKIEAILLIGVKTRLAEQHVRLKVNLTYKPTERTETNTYPYTITELTDATTP